MNSHVRAGERRNPAKDREDAFIEQVRVWLRTAPDLSSLTFAKRGGSVKVTTQTTASGEGLETLRAFNRERT